MDYKANYTHEEMAELADWFASRMDKFPKDFRFDAATYIPDLHRTAETICGILRNGSGQATFSGQIYTFYTLRKKLEEAGIS